MKGLGVRWEIIWGERSDITATEMEHSDSMATEGVQPGRDTLDLGEKGADGH